MVEGDKENDMILTSRAYFQFDHLASAGSANKFTEKGSITLSYHLVAGASNLTCR